MTALKKSRITDDADYSDQAESTDTTNGKKYYSWNVSQFPLEMNEIKWKRNQVCNHKTSK